MTEFNFVNNDARILDHW